MHDFFTPFDLRHTALIEYHVKQMRRLLRTRGVTARNDYRTYLADVPQMLRISKIWVITPGSLHSVQMVESVFRRFKDFDPYKGTPIDMMHNLESGIMKDLLEVRHPTSSRLCHIRFGWQVLEEYMSARALELSMAVNEFGEMATRPLTAAITVKAWKMTINGRLDRWVPWTGRRCVDIYQTSRRYEPSESFVDETSAGRLVDIESFLH